MKRLHRRPLAIREILAWADAFRESTGRWPTKDSGGIASTIFETWMRVDTALRVGLRDLPGGSSLAQLLAEKRKVRNIKNLPRLTESQILHWADEFHDRMGSWPSGNSGPIPNSEGENWSAINVALRAGARGLPGRTSLARLLAAHRGVRHRLQAPSFTEQQILAWADAHFQRTGAWPTTESGPIVEAPGETWIAVQMALRNGGRGLCGGYSLAMLLAERRGVRNTWTLPNLSVPQILAWADAYHERAGKWPHPASGPIPDAPGETWSAVNHALKRGSRGLPGGLSLTKLLARERDIRNRASLPRLSRKRILTWACAHHRRTDTWPIKESGAILEAPGETWAAMDAALRQGLRGLREGSSLARLLADHEKKRNLKALPPLSRKKILAWADAHFRRTGKWPNVNSGPIADAPREKWNAVDDALRQGHRGLSGGSSLLLLLAKKRGVRNPLDLPPLSKEQILGWADHHFQLTGAWPKYYSGAIADAPGETWAAVDSALRLGKRGLLGGSSLAKLLVARGIVRGRKTRAQHAGVSCEAMKI